MSELYWITRLDAANTVIIICFIASIIGFVCSLFAAVSNGVFENKEPCIERKCFRAFSISLTIFALLNIFVPSERDALLIYGIGGTIDYIKSNDTAKQLPDKCIQALDKLIDSYIEEPSENK